MLNEWMTFVGSTTSLAFEAQQVIGLRLVKMAYGGDAARDEAYLMVSEKTVAFDQTIATITRGGSSQAVVNDYLTKVRANCARLSAE